MVFFNVWTVDGKIMLKNSDNAKRNVYYSEAGRNANNLWKRKLYYWLSLFFMLLRIGVGSWI